MRCRFDLDAVPITVWLATRESGVQAWNDDGGANVT